MLGSGSAGGEGEPALPPPDTEAEGGQGPQFSFGDPAPGEEEEEDEDEDEEAKGSSPGDFRVLDPRSAKVDNDILALGKIIGTIGEYVNGDDDPQRAVAESEIEYCGTSYRRAAVADRQREAGRDVAHALPDWDPHRQTQGLAANGHPPPGRKGAAAGWRKRRRPGAVGAGIVQQCPTCGWEGTSRQSLAQHIARHGLTKRFRCSQCRFACYKKDRLRRHLLTHGARPPDHPGPQESEAVGIPGTGAEAAREGNVPLTPGGK
ncbi:hypothetical protein scyTo_0026677 [Scyliorhinus torazame]|uniref:C2H2-type domain-containing protein n=1 Tax=Scyliorhinus torazame TaxID=75743 RepID=A0A401QKP0_SCYTO|nr:hypothetical protein [Scyliorhinus torazame]